MMHIKCLEFNFLPVNTYIIWDDTLECAIIDPGCYYHGENDALAQFIGDNKLTVKLLLNTHLHFDHVFGNGFVENTFGIKAMADISDNPWIENIARRLASFGLKYEGHVPLVLPQNSLKEGDTVCFGHTTLHVLHVPGHSPGSLVFHNREDKVIFVGDVIFQGGGMGRTDFPDGDGPALVSGIKRKLLTLDPETTVYPGHGPATTIGFEQNFYK